MDTDYHSLIVDGVCMEKSKPIKLGNHVWAASRAALLKGTILSDDSVAASGSTVTGVFLAVFQQESLEGKRIGRNKG